MAEDTNIPDPATQTTEIANNIALEVGKLTFDGSSFNEAGLSAYTMSTTNLGKLL